MSEAQFVVLFSVVFAIFFAANALARVLSRTERKRLQVCVLTDGLFLVYIFVTGIWKAARPFAPPNWAMSLRVVSDAGDSSRLMWMAFVAGGILSFVSLLLWFFYLGGREAMESSRRAREEHGEAPFGAPDPKADQRTQ